MKTKKKRDSPGQPAPNDAARVLVNHAEIEQLTSACCVKAQYVGSVIANDACRVGNKALKACSFR